MGQLASAKSIRGMCSGILAMMHRVAHSRGDSVKQLQGTGRTFSGFLLFYLLDVLNFKSARCAFGLPVSYPIRYLWLPRR